MTKFIEEYYIKFEDIDAAGWLFYPRFFGFCHNAFEKWFNSCSSIGYAEIISKKNIGFPIVQVFANYYAPLQHGDFIQVSFVISKINTSSFVSEFSIFKKKDQTLSFNAKITNVCINFISKKSIKIPQDIRELLLLNYKNV